MDKSTGKTIRLGVFVTLGALIFTAGVYLIGQKQSLFSQTFTIRAVFGNVSGLQSGNNVRFSGINVGAVTSVTFINDSLIEVRMRIRESYRPYIKKNAVASVGTDGLMGNKLINISPGKGMADPVENEYMIHSYSRVDTDAIITTLNTTSDNAALLTHNLVELTNQIRSGKSTVHELLYGEEMRDEIMLTINNLRAASETANSITHQLNQVTRNIRQGEGTLGWLLTDTTAQEQISQTLQSLEQTGKNLQAITDSLTIVIETLKSGGGTASMLLNDTAAANDLKQTLENLNSGTTSLNNNLEALRYSWPFKKGIKKAEKEAAKKQER
ncbi:MAG: MlaD family protein [Cyclobacteriaceae bacterium]|jgi:phospholipid/cholesterol/gamma-HCH transport system substrate-binding protein|nr:MlaD family protein [Cyclobacteriaceae bacterium]